MYSFTNILIATDFSPAAWQAIKAGVALAKTQAGKIMLLHVYPNRDGNIDKTEKTHFENIGNKISKMAEEISQENGLSVKSQIVRGNISEIIPKYIDDNRIDLVLMGANSGNLDSHLGSHTILVIESSKLPVLVIPPILPING